MRHLLALTALLSLALACDNPDKLETSYNPDSLSAVAPTSVDSGSFTSADFRRLAWLHGRWRGFMPDGRAFFEQYAWANDSTIEMRAFADSSFANASDSSRITLRKGTIASEGPTARWVATRVDSMGADFAPQRGAGNSFTWTREDSTKWNSVLRWTDRDGKPQTRFYALHRYGR